MNTTNTQEPPMPNGFDTDEELIGYCEIHCETPVALFSAAQVNRMLFLSGNPDNIPDVPKDAWRQVHDYMEKLCKLARERMREVTFVPA